MNCAQSTAAVWCDAWGGYPAAPWPKFSTYFSECSPRDLRSRRFPRRSYGYQAKDHSLQRANGRDVTFTDGTRFFMGSSGAGAPPGGAPSPNDPGYRNNPCQPPPGWEGEIVDVSNRSFLEEH
ncbi:hypothetical protein [Candidatus Palauibacter sp.]|uniref:hypothetical protein n=1 Tax=Candidatus Palauibacter sp. TaxID=3101350 RepID=UPI003B029946